MTELEQTIIESAQKELVAVLAFYKEKASGIAAQDFDEAWQSYLGHFHGMNALVAIAHQAHSGLSPEARTVLLKIEEEHGTAYRALAN
ncbi:hypothetical protein SAMN05216178_6765 [Pseudomonas saponiphila]|jgi:hypothetical protein|uniref:Uncharacterized protein n=1 Tax=Pseudomonas saponiphila TaxID=556534 RepID=A0A1H4ZP88_9PSED|nr:hypothetical protein [Pseudomonas saponiphila]SED31929.1 hypothetical protein SAMN05216178_6765 [Pseudomonas saponiphila]